MLRCQRPGCNGTFVREGGETRCLTCSRQTPISTPVDLTTCSTDDLVTLFRRLHESAQRNWQARVAIIGELAGRLEGSGHKRCKVVAAMLAISEPYCRPLYKVSQSFTRQMMEEVRVPPTHFIQAAYTSDPEGWVKASENGHYSSAALERKIRAAKIGTAEAPDGPSEGTVYARCRTCGNAGWHELLPAPMLEV